MRGLLESNMHLVDALRDALLERHELIGTEITDVLEAAAAAGPDGSGDGGSGDDGRTIDLRAGRRAGRSARIDPPA